MARIEQISQSRPASYIIDVKDPEGYTALGRTIIEGHMSVFKYLLEQEFADVDVQMTEEKLSPLHLAIKYGGADYVNILLKHGAAVETVDNKGLFQCRK